MADTQGRSCELMTFKCLFFFFNLIFFLSGLLLISVGAVVQVFFHQYIQFFEGHYETPAIGLIILGVITLVVSFFGCCGAKRNDVKMLQIFISLMIVILVCEIAAVITVAVMRLDIEKIIKENLNVTMIHFDHPNALPTLLWNAMQNNLRCCGVNSYLDWENTPYGVNVTGVPDSCCVVEIPYCGHGVFGSVPSGKGSEILNINAKGCYQALRDAALSNIGAIAGVIAGLAFFQVLVMCMSSYLITSARESYARI